MIPAVGETAPSRLLRGFRTSKLIACLAVLTVVMFPARHCKAQEEAPPVDDMTAKYHFLSSEDTLAILDEEGRLKGYIEVTQPEEESDDVLSFDIVQGARK